MRTWSRVVMGLALNELHHSTPGTELCCSSSEDGQHDFHYHSFGIIMRIGTTIFRNPEGINNSPFVPPATSWIYSFCKNCSFQEAPSVPLNMCCFSKFQPSHMRFLLPGTFFLFLYLVYFYSSFKSLFRYCTIWEALPNPLTLTGIFNSSFR